MSLAAITGGAMFLPPSWALFSKYQTGRSVLSTTIISLSINTFFKFFAPILFDLTLTRAEEMVLGVSIPIVLLVLFELYARNKNKDISQYTNYSKLAVLKNEINFNEKEMDNGNSHGIKVIGIGISCTGLLILILSLIASNNAILVASMGIGVLLLGLFIFKKK